MSIVKFVLLTSSRSGSTWLIDRLNMQPGVEAHGGLFHDRRRVRPAIAGRDDYQRFIEVYGSSHRMRPYRVFAYLNQLYRKPQTVGFKLMYTHLRRHPELFAYLVAHRVKIVHLVRRNHLDVLVSEELARLLGTSHAQVGMKVEIPPVYVDPATVVERLLKRSRNAKIARGLLKLTPCPFIEVTYEALLEGEREFERIGKFIGLSKWNAQGQTNLAKRGTGRHSEAIANYEEVQGALTSTPYYSLLR